MSYKILILAIPGIGSHSSGFSNDMNDRIKRFAKNTSLQGNYHVLEALPFNQTGVDNNQNDLFNRLNYNNRLGGMLSMRKFTLEAFGDGVTFESNAHRENSVYRKVHTHLRSRIQELNALKEQNPGAKIVVVAASLGVHILSTYIWDVDHQQGIFKDNPATNEEDLKNLSHLFSIGCNIPLFISGIPQSQIKPFDKRNTTFKWDNYYDKDDVLGWPLADINTAFGQIVVDHEINTGMYAGSHVRYWDDREFVRSMVGKLNALIEE